MKNKFLFVLNNFFKLKRRKILLYVIDIAIYAILSLGLYFFFIPSKSIIADDGLKYFFSSLILFVFIFLFRNLFGVYKTVWRYTSTKANFMLGVSDAVACLFAIGFSMIFRVLQSFWVLPIISLIYVFVSYMERFSYRLLYKKTILNETRDLMKSVAIIGAGQLGATLVSDLNSSKDSRYFPICFFDNDSEKIGQKVSGLPVYNPKDAISIIKKNHISTVIFTVSGVENDEKQAMVDFYKSIGCEIKIFDTPIGNEKEETKQRVIRDFSIEDLLFRKQHLFLNETTKEFYKNKVVLITGGGGSIGSELCRQIASSNPKQLIIFDIYENNAYDIQQELIRKYGKELNLAVEIGSVRDIKRLENVFSYYKPNIVFHAAAHKHVPLMEHSSCEAIKNNVFGTYNTANMAEKYQVEKFVLISTDKAVNPTNIMGASKRLCEMIVQSRLDSKTSFEAVRFGNVLGSNGSVIPLFKRQIASGGPVTITDKRIIRYFMTIPEASQLVITAGAMGKKGELFVLDMGKPVKIYDLAKNMIELSGLKVDEDIKIEEIGLRPGEKLFEELLMNNEKLTKTENNLIYIEKDTPYSREEMENKLSTLKNAIETFEKEGIGSDAIHKAIKESVPTFVEPNEVNNKV